jgi:hypothetical protein
MRMEGILYRLRIGDLIHQLTPRTHQNIHSVDFIHIFSSGTGWLLMQVPDGFWNVLVQVEMVSGMF